jgi:hypothetical protein
MAGRPTREAVMNALLSALEAVVQISFTANTSIGSPVLGAPSSTAGLFLGLPVFGVGIQRGAVITLLSPLTLSQPATANGTAVAFETGFLTASRRFQWWTQVTAQPALFLRDGDEELTWPNTTLSLQTLKAEVWIYNNAGQNPDLAPITPLNNLLDAIDTVFAPDLPGTNRFTLGGLVYWCRRHGKTEKLPGDADGQAIAVADVEIIVP